jgi:hypothetical protein
VHRGLATHLPPIRPVTLLEPANAVLPRAMHSELRTRAPLRPNFSRSIEAHELPTNPPTVKEEVTAPNIASVMATQDGLDEKVSADGP